MSPQRRVIITALAIALAIGGAGAVAVAAPAAAVSPRPESDIRPVAFDSAMSIDTTDDHLIREHLQGLAGVQTPNDIERIQDTGLPAATLMNETNTEIIAAVVLTHGLRALSAVGPGCSTDSLCMTTATGTPYGSTGSGTLSGTRKNIASAAAYGRDARFTWTGGAVNVAWGVINDFGAPVTMTEVSR